jgi:YegS/Rv2252/BmrU family lipid kinase
MKRALLVYNPAARRAPKFEVLREACAQMEGWNITLQATAAKGHARQIAADAASERIDAVIACGGDGTVNEVANGLARSTTALAVVRGGTANVWAKEIGVKKGVANGLALLNNGDTRSIDLGCAGERYFVCMAGVGFDAEIVREMETNQLKRRFGAAAYVMTGFRLARTYRSRKVDISFDDCPAIGPLFWLMVGNSRNYGGVLNIAHMAKVDDGRLESLLLSRGGLWTLTRLLPLVLFKRHHRSKLVSHRTVSALHVRTADMPVQVDGEYVGETPLRFGVAPNALRVRVPRGPRSPLFT